MLKTKGLFSVLILLVLAHSASAVVISGGTSSTNTTAPTDDPGWANVGRYGPGSAVYLQNGWVLSVYHVSGSNTVTFDGVNHAVDTSQSLIRLKNADNTYTDLVLFRIVGTPTGAVDLTIVDSTPSVGTTVTMIGYGRDQEDTTTTWRTSTNPWEETTGGGPGTKTGYETTSTRTKQWGTNTIDTVDYVTTIDPAYGSGTFFLTDFDNVGPNEGQAIVGDSGGGVFVQDGGTWYLAGLMDYLTNYVNQPEDTAVYGNMTGTIDLTVYSDQIMSYVVPEPATMAMLTLGGLGILLRRKRNA